MPLLGQVITSITNIRLGCESLSRENSLVNMAHLKSGAYSSRAFMGLISEVKLLALLTNIRLGWKCVAVPK
jgi:hypothetical protein